MHFIWIFKGLEFRSELTICEAIGLRFVAGVWGFYSASCGFTELSTASTQVQGQCSGGKTLGKSCQGLGF